MKFPVRVRFKDPSYVDGSGNLHPGHLEELDPMVWNTDTSECDHTYEMCWRCLPNWEDYQGTIMINDQDVDLEMALDLRMRFGPDFMDEFKKELSKCKTLGDLFRFLGSLDPPRGT